MGHSIDVSLQHISENPSLVRRHSIEDFSTRAFFKR